MHLTAEYTEDRREVILSFLETPDHAHTLAQNPSGVTISMVNAALLHKHYYETSSSHLVVVPDSPCEASVRSGIRFR